MNLKEIPKNLESGLAKISQLAHVVLSKAGGLINKALGDHEKQKRYLKYLDQNNEKLFTFVGGVMIGFNLLALFLELICGIEYMGVQTILYQMLIFNPLTLVLMNMLKT